MVNDDNDGSGRSVKREAWGACVVFWVYMSILDISKSF